MIEQALSYVDPTDRDTWVKMGMAVYSEYGIDGFEVWNAWSSQADNYQPGAAKSTWRSFSRGGPVTVASLYYEARQAGWRPDEPLQASQRRIQTKRRTEPVRGPQVQAVYRAQDMINRAALMPHEYLARKGFPTIKAMVLDGQLLVPMRDIKTKALNSLQTIDGDGTKKFLYGGKASESVYELGRGFETYLCEGYATGLSIQAALKQGYRQARVVVCFSANNIPKVAKQIRIKKNIYVVADNDSSKTNAGQQAAEKTGLPWWMPPEPGDANDFSQARDVAELANALNQLRVLTDEY